ncbi:MAG: replicative DNA helicase [Aggregatilineales bacterium]
MSEQPAPYSQEAEEAVIGAVIANPNSFVSITAFLKPDDFFFMRHSYIWQAMLRMHERRDTVDYLTLNQELRDLGWLDLIGGPAYLTQLITSAPTSTHAEVYGRLVERAAIRRKLITAADEIKAIANNEEMPIERVTSEAEMRLFNVTDQQIKREFVAMNEAVSEYFERVEYLMVHQNESLGVPSNFRDLDELLGGFQRSDLLIFAGRPGMGKTSWLLTTAVNVARIGGRVAIFTMEMGVEQLVQRMISMETGISTQSLRLGRISAQEYSRFVEAAGRISNFPIFIDDTPALSPAQMRTKCRRLQHEHGIDLIILDYMQLMNSGGVYQNNRVQEISYISRSVKELARELNVPVISAAQLSRAVEQRQDKRPVLSDLRESGCLTGDSLVHLYDEGHYVPIRDLVGKRDFRVTSLNTTTYKLEAGTVINAFSTGTKPVFKMTTALGRNIRATGNHKFLTICGWKRLDELTESDHIALPRVLSEQAVQTMGDRGQLAPRYSTMVEQMATKLKLATSDIYWDKIVSIEADGEEEVFDLTVQEHHNFVANNIVVHNSIEQDADIVMFLYRDAVYNEATEFPNQADIIIAKHRNGPTGVVSLYFDKTITKFMDGVVRKVDLGDF